jgi:ribosomal protein L13E
MEVTKLVMKITDWNPIGIRTKGRRKNRWRKDVVNYLKRLKKLRNCRQLFEDRNACIDLV